MWPSRLGVEHFPWDSIATEILYHTYKGQSSKVLKRCLIRGEREKKPMIDILLAYIINCDLNLGLIEPAGLTLKAYLDYLVLWQKTRW